MSVVEAGRGAVYDRGYRPYEGPRGGRGAATFALYKASMRRALGLRRSWRQKVAPFTLLAVVVSCLALQYLLGFPFGWLRLEHQRVEQRLAELPVAGPRLARPGRLERTDVDPPARPRISAMETNGARVRRTSTSGHASRPVGPCGMPVRSSKFARKSE